MEDFRWSDAPFTGWGESVSVFERERWKRRTSLHDCYLKTSTASTALLTIVPCIFPLPVFSIMFINISRNFRDCFTEYERIWKEYRANQFDWLFVEFWEHPALDYLKRRLISIRSCWCDWIVGCFANRVMNVQLNWIIDNFWVDTCQGNWQPRVKVVIQHKSVGFSNRKLAAINKNTRTGNNRVAWGPHFTGRLAYFMRSFDYLHVKQSLLLLSIILIGFYTWLHSYGWILPCSLFNRFITCASLVP